MILFPSLRDGGGIRSSLVKEPGAGAALAGRDVAGNRAEYAALFERYAPRILRMAYFLVHDLVAAEDVVQETFTRGLLMQGTYRGEAKPDVWLTSIALNVCREMLRRQSVREDCVDPDTLDRARRRGARGILTSVMRRETASRLAIALGYLTDLQKEVFVLRYIEGFAYEYIARLLGVSVVGARGLAHRAKRMIRTKLPANVFPARAT